METSVAASPSPSIAKPLLGLFIGLLVGAGIGYWVLGLGPSEPLQTFGDAPAFTLTDHSGRVANSDDFRGKVVVASFMYTNCGDVCPMISSRMQTLQDRLRSEGMLGTSVQLLSFTVDPERDTVPVLAAYAQAHRADPDAWRFLTGPEDQLRALIVQGFHLAVVPAPRGQIPGAAADRPQTLIEVTHSDRLVLIDPQWQVRGYYEGLEVEPDRVVRDVRQLRG